MKDVVLVVEGGGSSELNNVFREAIDRLLNEQKTRVRKARKHWKTIPAGGRFAAWDKFLDMKSAFPDALVLLLVDSEGPTSDSEWMRSVWFSRAKEQPTLFFMVQCMEAWIIADGQHLEESFSHLKAGSLPKRPPEECSPEELRRALQVATQNCGWGPYEKRHGPLLLSSVRPEVVVQRCPSARAFLDGLDRLLA